MTNGDSGAISPSGRFARMEASLERIETKLDAKADNLLVIDIDKRVTVLETVATIREAVSEEKAKSIETRYRLLMGIVAFLTIVNLALGGVVALASIFPSVGP